MEYYISTHQWLHAFPPPLTPHFQKLLDTVLTQTTIKKPARPFCNIEAIVNSRPGEVNVVYALLSRYFVD